MGSMCAWWALYRRVARTRSRWISSSEENAAHDNLMQLNFETCPFEPFADRVWELRLNVTTDDAWYVAIAEALRLPLATLDRPLSKLRGVACKFLMPGSWIPRLHTLYSSNQAA
jgi:predicted nucleic acid-binding protein